MAKTSLSEALQYNYIHTVMIIINGSAGFWWCIFVNYSKEIINILFCNIIYYIVYTLYYVTISYLIVVDLINNLSFLIYFNSIITAHLEWNRPSWKTNQQEIKNFIWKTESCLPIRHIYNWIFSMLNNYLLCSIYSYNIVRKFHRVDIIIRISERTLQQTYGISKISRQNGCPGQVDWNLYRSVRKSPYGFSNYRVTKYYYKNIQYI